MSGRNIFPVKTAKELRSLRKQTVRRNGTAVSSAMLKALPVTVLLRTGKRGSAADMAVMSAVSTSAARCRPLSLSSISLSFSFFRACLTVSRRGRLYKETRLFGIFREGKGRDFSEM